MADDDVRYANTQNIYEVLVKIEKQLGRLADLYESALADYQPATHSQSTPGKRRMLRTTSVDR
jgi:hypothetical protein